MIASHDSNKSLKAVYEEPNWLIRKKEQESKMKIFPFPELVTAYLSTPKSQIYGCDRCDFQSIYKGNVDSHNEIQHEIDENEHADEFGIEEAINQRGNDFNQLGDTGKEKYGSLSMDKDLDNPMKKLHDLLKHIGEFDVCVKCEFETKFLYIVSKQGQSVDFSDKEDILDNDESDNFKEYVDDQGNEYENQK